MLYGFYSCGITEKMGASEMNKEKKMKQKCIYWDLNLDYLHSR